ncbi:MAG: hypothetical protein IJF80_03800 [Clostridia bacterium]|nr:hypothetical protein [Clostridia bacterium]
MKKVSMCLLLLFVILFSACSGTKAVKEDSEVAEDVMNYVALYHECDFSLDSYSIQKRQTNPENKTDYVWIEIVATNEECNYVANYEVEYVLYNEGWLIETCQLLNNEVDAYQPPEELFEQIMVEQSIGAFQMANGLDYYGDNRYIAEFVEVDSNYNEYLSMTYITSVEANYRLYTGWELFILERENASATIKAEKFMGTYKCSGSFNLGWDDYDAEITVFKVDEDYIYYKYYICVDWDTRHREPTKLEGEGKISIEDVNQKLLNYEDNANLWSIEIPKDESGDMFIIVLRNDGFRINGEQDVPYPGYYKMERE